MENEMKALESFWLEDKQFNEDMILYEQLGIY